LKTQSNCTTNQRFGQLGEQEEVYRT
jgi:hypothetical protein